MEFSTKELGYIRHWFELALKSNRSDLKDDDYVLGRFIINEHGARNLSDKKEEQIKNSSIEGGQHNETFWGLHFGDAYQWLYN